MKKRNKMIILSTIFTILSLLFITSGVTYGFMSFKARGLVTNTITSGGITFHYKEIDGKGHGISITDAYPVSSNDTAKTSSEAFDFRITSSTNSRVSIPYTVTARMTNNSDRVMGDIVDLYLTEVKNNIEKPTALFSTDVKKFNELEDYENRGSYVEKVLFTDTVTTSNYAKTFKLRMWIDASADFNGAVDYNNKAFSITINVNANGSLADSSSSSTTDPDDPGEYPPGGVYPTPPKNPWSTPEDPADPDDPDDDVTCTGGYYGLQCTCDHRYIAWTGGPYLDASGDQMDATRSNEINYPPANRFKCSCGDRTGYVVNTKQVFGQLCTSPSRSNRLNQMILTDNTVKTGANLSGTILSNEVESGLYREDTAVGNGGRSTPGTTYYFRGNVESNVAVFGTWDKELYAYDVYDTNDNYNNEYSVRFNTMAECQAGEAASELEIRKSCRQIYKAGDPMLWRIVRVNEDGTVRIILDEYIDLNEYKLNDDNKTAEALYYSNSTQAKQTLENWYATRLTAQEKAKVATGNYFCEAFKMSYHRTFNETQPGEPDLTHYDYYTSNLECTKDVNGKQYYSGAVATLSVDEALHAGGVVRFGFNRNHDVYLAKGVKTLNKHNWWLMSPTGIGFGYSDGYSWEMLGGVSVYCVTPKQGNYLRPVINLKADTTAHYDDNGYFVIDL